MELEMLYLKHMSTGWWDHRGNMPTWGPEWPPRVHRNCSWDQGGLTEHYTHVWVYQLFEGRVSWCRRKCSPLRRSQQNSAWRETLGRRELVSEVADRRHIPQNLCVIPCLLSVRFDLMVHQLLCSLKLITGLEGLTGEYRISRIHSRRMLNNCKRIVHVGINAAI